MTDATKKIYAIDEIRKTLSQNQVMTYEALSLKLSHISADKLRWHLLTLLETNEIFHHNVTDNIPFVYVWKGPPS